MSKNQSLADLIQTLDAAQRDAIMNILVQQAPVQQAQAKTPKPKAVYGEAATPKDKRVCQYTGETIPDAEAIHRARVMQLEQEIPGISNWKKSHVDILSTGKNALFGVKMGEKKYTKDFSKMNNSPFTSVFIPTTDKNSHRKWLARKHSELGNLTGREILDKLKLCGYAFSRKNCCWSTDSYGKPVSRRYGNAKGIIKDVALDELDND